MFRYFREWIATTVVLAVMLGCFTFTYHFGVESGNSKSKAQEEKIALVTQRQDAQAADLQRNCESETRNWNTFQRVIQAATNPPSQAGKQLTPEAVAALTAYREALVVSVGPKPDC